MKKKRIVLLQTGGTIAMKPEGGRVVLPPGGSDLLERVPELQEIAEVQTRELFHLDSADMQPSAWVQIARAIYRAITDDGVDGVVVAHGTDTMAYGSGLTAYLLGPVPVPVVFTGAQRPLSDVRTDARKNLVDAVLVATLAVPEVCVVFGACAYRAVRTSKVDAFGFEAFTSPNMAPLVRLGVDVEVSEQVRPPMRLSLFDGRIDDDVLALRVFPGLSPAFLRAAVGSGVRGIVLSTYGTGTLPHKERSLMPVLAEANERGVVVLAVSQCLRGYVELGRYEAGAEAKTARVVSGGALTVEAGLAKLMVGLGRHDDPESVRGFLELDTLGDGC